MIPDSMFNILGEQSTNPLIVLRADASQVAECRSIGKILDAMLKIRAIGRVSEGSRDQDSQRTAGTKQFDQVTMAKAIQNVIVPTKFHESFVLIREDRFGWELDGMNRH
jgi:hypothetical protein